ncbi:hypothetical protein C8N35_108191 [Breoghania corrubedonensis]|uniref:DUF1178 family protein n=1 Tax=Breoghania corrubedonensis TaxID=665038 RepID=A0A2T5V5X0_9HYPH|nr:DUF1178 family protein [Breoghania corrubedonensis]PTW59154.1 hypothetical protein C8N35_108191 [Breoghania corrubedonensis]
MIHYSLICSEGHEFEGWFRNAGEFDCQAGDGHLTCPVCGDDRISKALMAPAVSGTRDVEGSGAEVSRAEAAPHPVATTPEHASAMPMMAMPNPQQAQIVDMMRKLRNLITESADNVGARFASEARRMHYGDAEQRGIYGEATPEDARDLIEEGIEILPLPVLPEDKN